MKALVFDRFGGPEVLSYREIPDPELANGEALVEIQAIGLNFADVYRRRGHYHLVGEPPYLAGYEAAGVVVATRDEHGSEGPFRLGDRVAFADSPFANAERVAVPFEKLIPLPEDISAETAAALLLQGLTAQYLVRDSHDVRAGERVLVHAAAGGVGQLLIQLARARGARVLGVVSSDEKAAVAFARGAQECALSSEDWVARAQAFAERDGLRGVDVAYDSVGSTLLQSLDSVRIGGHVVFYGMAGGDPPRIDPRKLMDTSTRITGGDLWNVLRSADERRTRAAELFAAVRAGNLHVEIAARFSLAQGAAAHAFLESRQSVGKVLLIP